MQKNAQIVARKQIVYEELKKLPTFPFPNSCKIYYNTKVSFKNEKEETSFKRGTKEAVEFGVYFPIFRGAKKNLGHNKKIKNDLKHKHMQKYFLVPDEICFEY